MCHYLVSLYFFRRTRRNQTLRGTLTLNGSVCAKSCKGVPFWVIIFNFNIWPYFLSICQILAQNNFSNSYGLNCNRFGNTCNSWSTSYRDVLTVATVMTAPTAVWTHRNVCFSTTAGNVIQPNRPASRINVSKRLSVVPICNHQSQTLIK